MLDKLGGVYCTRPGSGPHKLRESMPLALFLKNRLKYALTGPEVKYILKQRLVKIDGKVRTMRVWRWCCSTMYLFSLCLLIYGSMVTLCQELILSG